MVVQITAGAVFQAGSPKPLFQAPQDPFTARTTWDATPDGNRFLLTTPATEASPTPFTVVLNWTALLKK